MLHGNREDTAPGPPERPPGSGGARGRPRGGRGRRGLAADDRRAGAPDGRRPGAVARLLPRADRARRPRPCAGPSPARRRRRRAGRAGRGARSSPSEEHDGPVPLRAAPPHPCRSRPLARSCRARPRPTRRALRPLRERGDLPQRSGRARDRDLLGPAARALGRAGDGEDDDAPARRRQPARRARRSRRRSRSTACRTARSMGHVHLKVREIAETVAFYRDVIGFGADGAARSAGGVPRRRRLPPSPGREHLGERRRAAAAARHGRASPRDDRPSRRERAQPRARAGRAVRTWTPRRATAPHSSAIRSANALRLVVAGSTP